MKKNDMGKKYLFEVVVYIDSEYLEQTITSIKDESEQYFCEQIHITLLNPIKVECKDYCEKLQHTYSDNVTYVEVEGESKVSAYNKAKTKILGEYVHFTTSSTFYEKKTFKNIGKYINGLEGEKHKLVSSHIKYVADILDLQKAECRDEKRWELKNSLSELPLFLNRYFISQDEVKAHEFREELEEGSFREFLLRCFLEQETVTDVANTMIYYSEPQENNIAKFKDKGEKWWYIPQVRDMLIPLLEELSVDGQVPIHIQNLIFYMIRMKFYHNTQSRYHYTIGNEEIDEFLIYIHRALQYIDDSVMLKKYDRRITPQFMNIYFAKLKNGSNGESCIETYRHISKDKFEVKIGDQVVAKQEDFLVSLQGFYTEIETKDRMIEAEIFQHYLLDSEVCSLKVVANGEVVEYTQVKGKVEKCFGRIVKEAYSVNVRIPKQKRKLINKVEFYMVVEGLEYKLISKFARKKLLSSIPTRVKEGRLCPFFQKMSRIHYIVLYNIAKVFFRQKKNQVAMLSDSRAELSGNLAFVDKELKEQGYDVKYFFKRTLKEKKTFKEFIELCKLMATSRYILVDDFYPLIYPIRLRKGTELIQVWHAMGAFKTVGFSRLGKPGGPNPRSITHRNYSAAITSAEGIRTNYAEAFGIPIERVHATGVPRTDIFFDENYISDKRCELYEKYPVLKDKKVVLFAPTFRGAGQGSAHYNFDWLDFSKVEKELGEDYVFVVKLHPFIKNIETVPQNNPIFLNLTAEREINDLLFVTDILITDYSSVIFEASLLNINTIFYVPDLQEYTASRDFYYPFERYTFGEIANDMDELIGSILHPNNDQEKLEEFKRHFCESCDGKATKRFVSTLFK